MQSTKKKDTQLTFFLTYHSGPTWQRAAIEGRERLKKRSAVKSFAGVDAPRVPLSALHLSLKGGRFKSFVGWITYPAYLDDVVEARYISQSQPTEPPAFFHISIFRKSHPNPKNIFCFNSSFFMFILLSWKLLA